MILFNSCPSESVHGRVFEHYGKYSIQFLSLRTTKGKTVASMSGRPGEALSVSPDGRSLLFTELDEANSDLMLLENFR
jgi:Tol biopolymer transport system component